MTDLETAARLALDALNDLVSTLDDDRAFMTSALSAITALRAALAQQAEPLQEYASIPGTNVRVRLPSRPHDAGSHDQRMTPAVQRVVDAADRRARDKAAMPADCTTPTDCRAHGCHGACLPSPPQPQAEPVSMDKIKNTHTTITRFDFEQRPDHEYAGLPHRLYTQSSTDGCYLCACLAEIDRLKQQAEPVVAVQAGCKTETDCTSIPWCSISGECHRKQAKPVRDVEAELRVALHRISLASQNSMSSKEECGRIARNALHAAPQQAEPVAEPVVFTDAAIEAALAEWFGEGRNDGSGFEGRMRAAIKAACDFKEAK